MKDKKNNKSVRLKFKFLLMNEFNDSIRNGINDRENVVKCLSDLCLVSLKEKKLTSVRNTFDIFEDLIKIYSSDEEVANSILKFHMNIVSDSEGKKIIQDLNYHSYIIDLLESFKDRKNLCAKVLKVIDRVLNINSIASELSDSSFIELLVYVLRISVKSSKITKKVSKIVSKLEKENLSQYKELCAAFIPVIKNTQPVDSTQEFYILAFSSACCESTMKEIGQYAIPAITDVCLFQQGNQNILKGALSIISQSPEKYVDLRIIEVIGSQTKKLKNDYKMLEDAISIVANKIPAKKTPLTFVSLAYYGLEVFSDNKKNIENALTVCFRSLTSTSESVNIPPSLITIVTTILSIFIHDKGIIRRCAAILHTLSSDPSNDAGLVYSAAPHLLLKAIHSNQGDSHSALLLSNALTNIVLDNKVLAGQLLTQENIKVLKEMCSAFREKPSIIKNILTIVKSVVLTKYSFSEFLDLSSDQKKIFQIDPRSVIPTLKKSMEDISVVKASFFLMFPTNNSIIPDILSKYTDDQEVVFAGLILGITDINTISRCLLSIGEPCLRFVYKTLQYTETQLSSQVIQFLLQLNNSNATNIIETQLSRKNEVVISSHFKLLYPVHIKIADKLSNMGLWSPTEEDAPIIVEALCFSKFDRDRLLSAVNLAHRIGMSSNIIVLLFDIIHKNLFDQVLVRKSIKIIVNCNNDEDLLKSVLQGNGITSSCAALHFYSEKVDIVVNFLTLLSRISSYDIAIEHFADPLILSQIARVSRLCENCSVLGCEIFSNMITSQPIVDILSKLDILDVAFAKFGPKSCALTRVLVDNNWKLKESQVKIVTQEFNENVLKYKREDAKSLCELLYDITGENRVRIKSRPLASLITMYNTDLYIIQLAGKLVPFVEDLDEELMFNIFDSMRNNIKDFDVVFSLIRVLDIIETINNQTLVKVLIQVVDEYPEESSICSRVFPFLHKQQEAFSASMKAFSPNKASDDLAIIALYMMVSSFNNHLFLPTIFNAMEKHADSFEVCTYLGPVIYFCSENPESHNVIIEYLPTILSASVRFLNSNRLSRAVVAILCRISDDIKFVPRICQTIQYIIMILRAWIQDIQINQAFCGIIVNICSAGKFECLTEILPSLAIVLRMKIYIQGACEAIIALSPIVNQYSSSYSEILLSIISDKTVSEEVESQKILASECLLSLAPNDLMDSYICENLSNIFSLITETNNEQLKVNLLKFISNIKNEESADSFNPFMEMLVKYMENTDIKISTAAGHVLLQIALCKKTVVDPYLSQISNIGKNASGDKFTVYLAIRDACLGVKNT